MRYAYGIGLCLIGSCILVFNEKKVDTENKNIVKDRSIKLGVMASLGSVLCGSIMNIANKILANNKISIFQQMTYIAIFTTIYSIIGMLITWSCYYCVGYFVMCMGHAVFFYCGNFLFNQGIQIIDLSKSALINYTKIVWVLILGACILGEPIFATDLLGSAIIVSYMVYNITKPIKEK